MTRAKIARLGRGWSLTETAAKAKVARGDLSKWERGIGHPYPKAARRLGDALGVYPAELQEQIADAIAERTVRDIRRGQWLRAHRRMAPDMLALHCGGWAQADELATQFGGWTIPTLDELVRWRQEHRDMVDEVTPADVADDFDAATAERIVAKLGGRRIEAGHGA